MHKFICSHCCSTVKPPFACNRFSMTMAAMNSGTHLAMICAVVVLPMPGGPDSRIAFLLMSSFAPRAPGAALGAAPFTCTACQPESHCRMVLMPCGLPTRSAALCGFHLSTHSWLPAQARFHEVSVSGQPRTQHAALSQQ